jgi:hypothetical protein
MERLILQKSNTWGCVDFEGIRRTAERPIMIGEPLRNVARFKISKYFNFFILSSSYFAVVLIVLDSRAAGRIDGR